MFKNFLLITYRNLTKNKLFTFINIAGLSIGMAVALLILNFVSFEFSYDKLHEKRGQIYRVESQFYEGNTLTDNWATSSFGYASAMKENIEGIQDFVRIDLRQLEQTVSYKDKKYLESKVVVTEPSFFNIFSFPLLKGDKNTALSRPNTVVISEKASKKYFQHNNPIGKVLRFRTLQQTFTCEVTGILQDIPANSHINFDFFISWETQPDWVKDFWYLHEVYSYVLLSENINPRVVEAAFPAMAERYKTNDALKNKKWVIELKPLIDIHLTSQKQYEREAKGNRKAINALILIAFAILLIAWINYVNLTTSRSLERAREVGVRKASGAFKWQLVVQFLTESTLVNFVAFIFAMTLFFITLPFFNNFMGKQIGFSLLYFKELWVILSAFLIIGIFVSGLYPAFVLSAVKTVNILNGRYINTKSAGLIRKGLVVFQFAVSLFLICGTLVVFAQIRYMQNQPLGMEIENTLAFKYPSYTSNLAEKVKSFKRVIKDIPGINNVAISNAVPGMEVAYFASNHLTSDPNKQNRLYEMQTIDYDFIETYGINLIKGRGFLEKYTNDNNNILLNKAAVIQLGFKSVDDAIGKKINIEGQNVPFEIVGVVRDYHQQSLNKAYTPIMMIMYDRIGWLRPNYVSVKYNQENLVPVTNKIRNLWNEYFPESTFDYFFTEQYYNSQYALDKRFGFIFSMFGGLAIAISCLGLWALSLFTGLIREKEMGVRKVLGASNQSLFYNLIKEFVPFLIIAIIIALPVSFFAMNSWLNNYAFRINMKWWFFVIPAFAIVGISFLTIVWQTFKTTQSNPVDCLKYE
jgi:putative ABC transport system permease protein